MEWLEWDTRYEGSLASVESAGYWPDQLVTRREHRFPAADISNVAPANVAPAAAQQSGDENKENVPLTTAVADSNPDDAVFDGQIEPAAALDVDESDSEGSSSNTY